MAVCFLAMVRARVYVCGWVERIVKRKPRDKVSAELIIILKKLENSLNTCQWGLVTKLLLNVSKTK